MQVFDDAEDHDYFLELLNYRTLASFYFTKRHYVRLLRMGGVLLR